MKQGGNRIIHLIDDDDRFCHNLSLTLSSRGYSVKKYTSPITFLSKVDKNTQGCIILDINMPDMDGLALQKRLNDLGIQLKIIFLSGHADVPKCAQAMKAGALDFFEKPVLINELVPILEKALAHGHERAHRKLSAQKSLKQYESLTRREKQVFHFIVQGNTSPQIARQLGVKVSTVLMHRKNLFAKLKLNSIAKLINFANKNNL